MVFHQQHTDACLANDAGHGPLDVEHHGGLDAFGGLIEQQQAGLAEEGPGDRQLLLLTAGKVAAPPVEELLQHREQLEHQRIDVAMAADATGPGLQTQQQIFPHAELSDDISPLRHVADATAGPLMGGLGGDIRTSQHDGAAALLQQADDRLEQGGLADPIEADQAHHLTGRNRKIDIAQDVAFAVIHIQVANAEKIATFVAGMGQGWGGGDHGHGCSSLDGRSGKTEGGAIPGSKSSSTPRYTSITRGSLCTASMLPSQST